MTPTHLVPFFLTLSLMACADAQDSGATADAKEATSLAELLRSRSTLAGDLNAGPVTASTSPEAEYLAFTLQGSLGDDVMVDVDAPGLDPVVVLVDENYLVLRKDDSQPSEDEQAWLTFRADQRVLALVTDAYRRPGTFTVAASGFTTADANDLARFLALGAEAQRDELYSAFTVTGVWDYPATELQEPFARPGEEVRISSSFSGAQRTTLLNAYYDVRDACRDAGGTFPEVYGLRKGGLIYALELQCWEDNEDVEWGYLRTIDAEGDLIGELGQVGF